MTRHLPRRQEHRHLDDRFVSFGKYAGRRYKDVPTPYLRWFAQQAYRQMVNRNSWAVQELERRGEKVPEWNVERKRRQKKLRKEVRKNLEQNIAPEKLARLRAISA